MHEEKKKREMKKLIKCVVKVEALGLNGYWEVIDKSLGLNEVEKTFRLIKHFGVLEKIEKFESFICFVEN